MVEPGTETSPQIAALLKRFKLQDRVINGADVKSLQTLDGIVSAFNSRIADNVVEAFLQASRSGVGIAVVGNFGSESPGNTAEIREFIGLSQAKENFRTFAAQSPNLIKFDVVAPEEFLVGAFERNASPGIQMEFVCGYTGAVDGTPLLALPEGMDPDFCPAFIRQHGKGRVAVMQPFVNTSNINMAAIMNALRVSANWVCKRPPDADWKAVRAKMGEIAAQSATAAPAGVAAYRAGIVISHLSEKRANFDYKKTSAVVGVDPYANALGNMVVGLQTVGLIPYFLLDEGELARRETRAWLDQAGFSDRVLEWKTPERYKQVDVLIV